VRRRERDQSLDARKPTTPTVGVIGFVWWLTALATGRESYDWFMNWATWWPFWIVPIGLSLAFFQHMSTGVRHFVLDVGAGYELRTNKRGAVVTMVVAVTLTLAMWGYIAWRTFA